MENEMVDETGTTATAPAAAATGKRGRKAQTTTGRGRKARVGAVAVRHSYKQEVDLLRVECERLRNQVARLQSAPATHEQGLILKTAETSFRAGMETGLLLQGAK